ncbi:MAG: polymer-forming cytoskeletal protein [Verrucomicrobiota bacterium]
MFGRFKRAKTIELVCPYCGSRQEEPASAISTFCRACGEHFRIRRGQALASPGLKVSGIAEVVAPEKRKKPFALRWSDEPSDSNEAEAQAVPGDTWLSDPENQNGKPLPIETEKVDSEEPIGISAGAFFGLVEDDEKESELENDSSLGKNAQSKSALAEGSMEALIGNQPPGVPLEKRKMPPNYVPPEERKKSSESASQIDVRCFRCYHIQQVSRYAKSTQCERCSVYISLANYEIRAKKSHTLRTRGDITIARRGGLRDSEIACHHLTVNGPIDAVVDCSGDATFRHSGVVRGNLHCRRLHIDRNCEVEFPDGVMAQRAEISGTLNGNLTCSGKVRVARTGVISGNVTAIEVEVREGGKIGGDSKIDPNTCTELSVKKGTNPTVIG